MIKRGGEEKFKKNNCTYLTSPWNYDHGISVCVDDPDFF